jgi:mannose-6-phosphate isomerase-like protein (cupin superfamily)
MTEQELGSYLRHVDFNAAKATSERYNQALLDRTSGGSACMVAYIQTPPGGGSPAGLHFHDVEQVFYILSGTMDIEIEGNEFKAGPGSLVIFPARVPHRNWNGGLEPTVHLAINVPAPDPDKVFSQPVSG